MTALVHLLADLPPPDSPEGGAGIALVLLVLTVGLVSFGFWIWALVHAIKNPKLTDTLRIIWVLVIWTVAHAAVAVARPIRP